MSKCELCGDKATHLPVVSFFGETEAYCCGCFDCQFDDCQEEMVSK